MRCAFTWLPKFTDALEAIDDEGERGRFALALIRYGTLGEVPALVFPYTMAFAAIKEDIDNSVNNRTKNKGGRPKKKTPVEVSGEVSDEVKTTVKTPVTKPENRGLENGNPDHTKPSHTKPSQTKGGEGRARFAPPAPAEVARYAESHGLALDAERFVDYFAAQGWRLSNGNRMRDWKAAARNWAKRDGVSTNGHRPSADAAYLDATMERI